MHARLHWPRTSGQMLNTSVNCRHVRYLPCRILVLSVTVGCSFRDRGAGTQSSVANSLKYSVLFHCDASSRLHISQQSRMWLWPKDPASFFLDVTNHRKVTSSMSGKQERESWMQELVVMGYMYFRTKLYFHLKTEHRDFCNPFHVIWTAQFLASHINCELQLPASRPCH